MKKTLLILFVLSFCLVQAQAQTTDVKPEMRAQYQIDFTRYCLNKYRKEKITSYVFSTAGAVFLTAGFTVEPDRKNRNDLKTNFLLTGGLSAVIGMIVLVDSEKWFKRAYIGPDGFGVVFKF